jgi:hypothetical protein
VRLILKNSYNKYLRVWISFSLKNIFLILFLFLPRSCRNCFLNLLANFRCLFIFWIVSFARNRVNNLIALTVVSSSAAGGFRRPSGDGDGRRLSADRIVKPALRRYIMCQRYARRYLVKFDKIFYCTRFEKNILYFYYATRKYLYLFIFGFFINILANLQFKIGRLTAGSFSITQSVIIQLARNLDFRI